MKTNILNLKQLELLHGGQNSSSLESSFGSTTDLSSVNVHQSSSTNYNGNANAYTTGSDIAFNTGAYMPCSSFTTSYYPTLISVVSGG